MDSVRWIRWTALIVLILIPAGPALAQQPGDDEPSTSGQLWADLRLVWPNSADDWLFKLDLKPKVQFEGSEKWAKLVVAPAAVYQAPKLLDVSGDLLMAYTVQNDDVESFELVPRIGVQLHLISDVRDVHPAGRVANRLGLATLVRLEYRSFWYTGSGADESHDSDLRLRLRAESRIGLNSADRSRPGTWYIMADAEAFVPLNDRLPETFATEWRFRFGPGLRATTGWSFELLFVHDIARNTLQDDFDADVNAIDLRVHRFF